MRATVAAVFRVPLNVLVIGGLLLASAIDDECVHRRSPPRRKMVGIRRGTESVGSLGRALNSKMSRSLAEKI